MSATPPSSSRSPPAAGSVRALQTAWVSNHGVRTLIVKGTYELTPGTLQLVTDDPEPVLTEPQQHRHIRGILRPSDHVSAETPPHIYLNGHTSPVADASATLTVVATIGGAERAIALSPSSRHEPIYIDLPVAHIHLSSPIRLTNLGSRTSLQSEFPSWRPRVTVHGSTGAAERILFAKILHADADAGRVTVTWCTTLQPKDGREVMLSLVHHAKDERLDEISQEPRLGDLNTVCLTDPYAQRGWLPFTIAQDSPTTATHDTTADAPLSPPAHGSTPPSALVVPPPPFAPPARLPGLQPPRAGLPSYMRHEPPATSNPATPSRLPDSPEGGVAPPPLLSAEHAEQSRIWLLWSDESQREAITKQYSAFVDPHDVGDPSRRSALGFILMTAPSDPLSGSTLAEASGVPSRRIVHGHARINLDPTHILQSTIEVASADGQPDEALRKLLDRARDISELPLISSKDLESLVAQIQVAWTKVNGSTSLRWPKETIEGKLFEKRHYASRRVFGGPHIRFTLEVNRARYTCYIPESSLPQLPQLPSFGARCIADLHPTQEPNEPESTCLRILTLARVESGRSE